MEATTYIKAKRKSLERLTSASSRQKNIQELKSQSPEYPLRCLLFVCCCTITTRSTEGIVTAGSKGTTGYQRITYGAVWIPATGVRSFHRLTAKFRIICAVRESVMSDRAQTSGLLQVGCASTTLTSIYCLCQFYE